MLLLALLALAADPPPPAMVTSVSGTVTVVDGKSRVPAPAPPFLLAATQSLDLAAGAHVVMLRQGGAFAVDGPRTVDPTAFKAPTSGGDKVGDLLKKRTSLAAAGAARGAGPAITRPVPNAPAFEVTEVRWSCDACGEQEVKVLDLRADAVVWTGKGTGGATLAAPLAPGTYSVNVGGTERTFRVVPRADADALVASINPDAIPDPKDRAAAVAGALFLGGYATDALRTLEAAGLTDQVDDYEKNAGVAP